MNVDPAASQGLKISVAICTWNRSEVLAVALDRLAQATRPSGVNWDVLIVNNACSDDTSAVVASFVDRLPIRETFEPRQGVSHARNRALTETAGSHIAFIDDDVRVEQEWLTTLARLVVTYPGIAMFAGPVHPHFPVAPDPDLVRASPYLSKGFCGSDHLQPEGLLEDSLLPTTANVAFRRAAIEGLEFASPLGPVRDLGGGHDDSDFVRRVRERGGEAIWSPQLNVEHWVDPSRMELGYLLRLERNKARTRIRASQIQSKLKLWGVPVSTIGGFAVAHAVYAFWWLMPSPRQRLVWMVKCHRFRAKVQEYRV